MKFPKISLRVKLRVRFLLSDSCTRLSKKSYIDKLPVNCKLLGTLFGIDGELLERQYRNHLSGYLKWSQLVHAEE